MMLFQRRLFSELLWNTLTTVALLTAVLMLIICAQVVHRTEGLTLLTFARSVPVFAATQLDLTLPMAVLVAVVLTYGRAAADNEMDTLRASGVHPLQVVLPGLVFGALMSVVLLFGMDYAKPWAEAAKLRLARDTDFKSILNAKLSSGEPVSIDPKTVISAEGFDAQGHALSMRVQLYDDRGNLTTEYLANSADLRMSADGADIELTLNELQTVKGPKLTSRQIVLTRPLPRDLAELGADGLTTPQLMATLRRPPEQLAGGRLKEAQLAVDSRLAAAAACLLFVLLGLPVALLFRRHDRTGAFLVAFLVALFVYYPSREITRVLSERAVLSASLASWAGNAVLLLVSATLGWWVFRR